MLYLILYTYLIIDLILIVYFKYLAFIIIVVGQLSINEQI